MSDRNTGIIEEFRSSGGKAKAFGDKPLVIVHTIGAKTGRVREIPLATLPDGERLVIFASKAGANTNPDWYHNLKANPIVEVEFGTERFTVKATEVPDPQRQAYFDEQVGVMPQFAGYVESAGDRVIPVLALDRI